MPPPYLEAICAVLDILDSDEYEALRGRLDANVRRLAGGLERLGLAVLGGSPPIVSVLVGDEADTLAAGRFLFDRGYYVQSVVFPAVPYHAGVLRIQANANHPPEAIDGLLDALASAPRRRSRCPAPRSSAGRGLTGPGAPPPMSLGKLEVRPADGRRRGRPGPRRGPDRPGDEAGRASVGRLVAGGAGRA